MKVVPLLERESELAVLDAGLAGARQGRGAMLVVAGEPGIGKTSLVTAWQARLQDVRLLTGGCDDLATPRPLGPIRDLVRGSEGPLTTALADDADRPATLAALLDEVTNPLRPTVVVLEDLQWADEATLDALRFLGRRVHELPTVVVGTHRDDLPPEHALLAALDVLPAGTVQRLSLRGLSAAAVRDLAGTQGRARDLHAVTGGNPFFVTEILAAPEEEIPATVRGAVAARLRQLSDASRSALERLAVAPGGLAIPLTASVLAGGLGALAEPERRGLVELVDGVARFRHELTRRAVVAATPRSEQALSHAAILGALDREATEPAEVLHHAIGAGDPVAIVACAPEAARRAAGAGAHREAADAYGWALRYPERLVDGQLTELLTARARELLLTGRFDTAVELAERAVAVAEAGRPPSRLEAPARPEDPGQPQDPEHAEEPVDPAPLGGALATLAEARYWALRGASALEAAERAVEVLSRRPASHASVHAGNVLAFCLIVAARYGEAEEHAAHNRQLAHEVGDRAAELRARTYLAVAQVLGGDDALEQLGGVLEAARQESFHEEVVNASIGLVTGCFRLGRLAEAEEAMDLGLQYAGEHELQAHATTLLAMRAGLDLSRGRWTEASERLAPLLREPLGTGWGETIATALGGRLRARRQDPEATQLLDHAWRTALASGEIRRVGPAGAAWAEWGWLTGHADVVRDRVDHAIAAARDAGHGWYLGELLCFRMRGGDDVSPRDLDTVPEPWASSLRGDWAAAAEAWRTQGWPYEQALELAGSGETPAMLEGLAILDRLGAESAAAVLRRQLRSRGVARIPRGPLAGTRRDPAGLTPRQRQILQLVAQGLTNAEVAHRLVLSVRTVDHHVSAALGKLGVTSRREAVARAQQLGVFPDPPAGRPPRDTEPA